MKIRDDVRAMEEGEWFDHPDFDGVRVQVRSADSEYVRKRRATLLERSRGVEGVDTHLLGEKIEMQIAGSCLVGWEGIDGDDGEELKFSEQAALAMAEDKAYWSFLRGVSVRARQVGSVKRAQLQESVGN